MQIWGSDGQNVKIVRFLYIFWNILNKRQFGSRMCKKGFYLKSLKFFQIGENGRKLCHWP